jgi:hypothetical protein
MIVNTTGYVDTNPGCTMVTSPSTHTSSAIVEPDLERFCANMGALWRRDAELAQRIDDLPVEAGAEVLAARSGLPTVRVSTPAGRPLFLHSRYDPMAEARKFVDAIDCEKAWCFVIGGLGMGYHVQALLERLRGDGARRPVRADRGGQAAVFDRHRRRRHAPAPRPA